MAEREAPRERPVILSVDDDPAMHVLIERLLKHESYELVFATSGEEALAMITGGLTPDLVLLDVSMPGMDGYTVAEQLLSNSTTALVPVVFVTASADENDKARAFAVGAVDYLVKPIVRAMLEQTMRVHLKTASRWKWMQANSSVAVVETSSVQRFDEFKSYLATQEDLKEDAKETLRKTQPSALYERCSGLGIGGSSVAKHIADFLRIPHLNQINPEDVLLGVLPSSYSRSNHVVPLSSAGGARVLAVGNPFDWGIRDLIDRLPELRSFSLTVTDPVNIEWIFGLSDAIKGDSPADDLRFDWTWNKDDPQALTGFGDGREGPTEDLEDRGDAVPVVRLANLLIAKGIDAHASDIHVEPRENSVGVRYRIDGVLSEKEALPRRLLNGLVSRFKIMARLDISERRLPQDGRIRVTYRGQARDLRVSTLPSSYGEKVVIRILDGGAVSLDFAALGFDERQQTIFWKGLAKSHGILLVTGPTGSGKSTTLYTALQALNTPERNIVTVEDPVEFGIHRLTQVQVQTETGLTFPAALRSILRQDPDVIMIGEMRDRETVEIAIRAALTGHAVLSTLHANDAISTVSRLLDMGVQAPLIASALELVIAQRLVRRLCPQCKIPASVSIETLNACGLDQSKASGLHEAVGCPNCAGTGYRGRIAVIEMLPVDEDVRRTISEGTSLEALRRHVFESLGMRTIRESALLKAVEGQTSIEEVIRVTGTKAE